MNPDREDRGGRVPLPGFGDRAPGDPAAGGSAPGDPGPGDWGSRRQVAPDRRDGIRHARRMSNWTLAALIAGTGAATVALAHQAFPTATAAGTTAGTTGAGTTATAHGASGPQVGHSVATTSGSGVTVTTTTHTVNGKTVVTHVRHVPAYHDN
ncbi:MAG: hypothetical protein ACLP5E_30585 [Streptosporangiaceae bacterium]